MDRGVMDVVINALQYKKNSSGIGIMLRELFGAYSGLARRRCRIVLPADGPDFPAGPGAEVVRVPWSHGQGLGRMFFQTFQLGRRYCKDAVLLATDSKAPLILPPNCILIPLVTDLAVYRLKEAYQLSRVVWWRLQYRYVCRCADRFLAVSEFTKREMVDILHIPPEKIAVVPCACSSEMRPVADPAAIALFFLSEEAAKKVKVVLSGEGSDELFGGYNIYCEPLEHTTFNKIPMPIRRALGKFAEYCLPRRMKGRGFLMRHGKTLEERYFANATNIFTEREADKLLKKGCVPGIRQVTDPLYERVKGKDSVTKMQYVDLHLWLVHDILMKGDKMGMANSLEVRVPFLDRKVLELAETLPLDYKVRAPKTKVALRGAAEKVIRSKTAEKKKLGFPIPIRVWLREEKYYERVREMFTSEAARKFFNTEILLKMLDEHKKGRNINEKADDSRKIWSVYIFLVWYDRFFGHEKPVHPASTMLH